MQHSPQEIKTRLGEAVDPEGNVLNMAAVVEVIGLLERTPLTKEALEQTRIGRTVNLLRKKTENEDIARRAKKLVKRWQKLVQNHLEAVRNTNSPLNGLRCSSPVVNGSEKDEEKQLGSAEEVTIKARHSDQHNRVTKRKRNSVDTPPPGGGHTQDNSGITRREVDTGSEKDNEYNLSQDSGLPSTQSTVDPEDSQETACTTSTSLDDVQNETHLCKRMKIVDHNETESACAETRKLIDADEVNALDASYTLVESRCEKTNTLDHQDVRWEGKDFSQQTEDFADNDTVRDRTDLAGLSLDVEDRAHGINGRFGEDGEWYSWSETMSCNTSNLVILPYVLLE